VGWAFGYSEAEIKLVMKSKKRIEDKTPCQRSYIDSNLKNKEIGPVGKIFDTEWDGGCFQGAYVDGLGLGTSVRMVVIEVSFSDTESTIGLLLVHEILHWWLGTHRRD
jgi:hypothetical protein